MSEPLSPASLAALIDHTLLKAEAGVEEVDQLCDEAAGHGFASVCVNGTFVKHAAERLAGSGVKVCSVAGFPLGAMRATVKAIEATAACKDGAEEVDFVAHLPHLIRGDAEAARGEFYEVVSAARAVRGKVVVKVILETAAVMAGVDATEAERRIAAACEAARTSGCDFVKTSTGFHPAGGATVEAVRLMKRHGEGLRVKASGGIRTRDDALRMIDAGADRLGCSAGVSIIGGGGGSGGTY